uniref:Uncharacterized protein n=1 Tax=Tetradesmus obliquus TaxID=3088 RepID=A0A383VX95_TETOB|eukprot:jgi/Sobl393_1/8203/SZX69384.1
MTTVEQDAIALCDLPDSYLRQLCASLPKHLQQRLRQTCRKLQQLLDAAAGVTLSLQPFSAALRLPGVTQHLVALDIRSAAACASTYLQDSNQAIMEQLQRAAQLPRLSRLRCDISNAGGIVAAVAAASPNLAQLELHCRDDPTSSCYTWNLAGAAAPSSHRAIVMCRGLLELPPVLRSLQHLQLDAAMLGLQCGVPAAARFIGALTTLRSLTVRGSFTETCNHWRVLRKESFVPLQQLTQLDLPDWVVVEAPLAGATGPTRLQALTYLLTQNYNPGHAFADALNPDNFPWLLSQRSSTSLCLFTNWLDPQLLQRSIADLAQQRQQLRSLALTDLNSAPGFPASHIEWGQLAPLAGCLLLTRLELEGFVLQQPGAAAAAGDAAEHDAAGADDPAHPPEGALQDAGLLPHVHAGAAQQVAATAEPGAAIDALPGLQPVLQASHAVAAAGDSASQVPGSVLRSLQGLRQLSISSMGCAVWCCPLSRLAPNITRLQHKDFDDDEDSNHPPEELLAVLPACSTAHRDALAGLQQLAVLDTTIECLAAHAAFGGLAQLSNLTELRIEMVGVVRRPGSCLAQQGLQQLPQLKRMELYTNDYDSPEWATTYNAAEDHLLWQNQAQLQQLCLRGSARLGRIFPVAVFGDTLGLEESNGSDRLDDAAEDQLLRQNQAQLQQLSLQGGASWPVGGFSDTTLGSVLLVQLPACLPLLQTIELVHCPDLTFQHLLQLAVSGAVPSLVVQRCAGISDFDCLEAGAAAEGRLEVLYEA